MALSVAAEQLGIFSTPGWLDQVCGVDNWDACISFDKGGRVKGMMPFCFKYYLGQMVIRMPTITPFFDICIQDPQEMESLRSKILFRREVVATLAQQLPKALYFSQHYSYSLVDWLPFHWQGFKQTTQYSFVFSGGNSIDILFKGLQSATRNMINRAAQQARPIESEDIDKFYALNEKTFQRKGLTLPYSQEFLVRLFAYFRQKKQAKIYFAESSTGDKYAGILIVGDHKTDYYLASGFDKDRAIPGAVQFLLWHGIKSALSQGKSFDFEGSMIPGVAKMFSGFGAEQRPYHKIYKGQNKFMQILNILRR